MDFFSNVFSFFYILIEYKNGFEIFIVICITYLKRVKKRRKMIKGLKAQFALFFLSKLMPAKKKCFKLD